MVKVGKWIAKHRVLMLIIGFLLIIPSVIGMAKTRVNYDLLSYLPEHLETVKGQDILVDEYGMGAFSMVVVENMDMKDVQKLEDQFSEVPHVKDVLWYDDVADISLPVEMIPKDLKEAFFKGDATMMLVLFDNTTSSDEAMDAVGQMRKLANDQCFISGMTGVVTDIKNLALKELPVYVVIAALLSLVVLELTSGSFVVPILFLISIGLAILYNLGSNIFLGETSYITKALTAVLQLGVTMDYSIFLLNSYEENKKRFPGEKERAMGHAISNTFKSVAGSSVTTVAGFVALCVMTFALGRDLGIVMAKGVLIGVICCVTVLPSLVLVFDKPIEKTKHKLLFSNMDKPSAFITKHYKVWIVVFLVLLFPAIYGNNHTKIYYNIADSLPSTLDSNVANAELKKDFDMSNIHMVSATEEVNTQIASIDKIVKSYDKNAMVIGEAPLMKDLEDVTNVDLVNVNALSIAAIFIIIMIIFKSISLPIILVAVIEFAIMVNMAIPFYQGTSLPFVASIVIGAIQLGATVDYAILMTTRYQKERQRGRDKMEAISIAHKTSMPSIISSGLSFFAATFGVACYSQVEMIGSICTLLARGAIISMVVVILILPAMFMIFDKVICKTSIGFLGGKK
ncbi:MAG: MMPL family transporter [Clostridiales bacterium]|nr:MMPL family transporter [Clostridiales bacterium]